ncbi:sensor histidine kinase [Ferrimonas kyonanensis]|uniref:sensor histidine kinase n=1 Tax=Ferrimonas kyonanensis TaxID=364763 RepID=UPI00040B9849|nr:histidine kinase [Ferrimonas kyonanensis]
MNDVHIGRFHRDNLKSFGFTALFCFVIAIATYQLWPSAFTVHLLISYGYGLSGFAGSRLIMTLWPSLNQRWTVLGAVSGAMSIGSVNAWFWLSDAPGFDSFDGMKPVLMLALLFTVTCYYYYYAKAQKAIIEQQMEAARRRQSEQERALALSQLAQLQSQIEPHFLFNTLANIMVLIDTDADKAKRMLERLTQLLRTTLKSNRAQQIGVDEEISLIRAYLELQQIRLGQRLSFDIHCDPALMGHSLPPLLLQPLVENALYHGLEPQEDGGHIQVCLSQQQDRVQLLVSDNGGGLQHSGKTHQGQGLGLSNLRARLKALFDGKASLSIVENASGGVDSRVSLPLTELSSLPEPSHD